MNPLQRVGAIPDLADPQAMMRELLGRAGGCCAGKGGSMHIADFSVGMLGANGVVGAGIPIAVGAAHGAKLKGEDKVVACFFGDGAVNRGPFLEGLNWAKIFELPVLLVCEDNGFASTTRARAVTAGAGAAARAASFDIPAHAVDGNDVVAVDGLVGDCVAVAGLGKDTTLTRAQNHLCAGASAEPEPPKPHQAAAGWSSPSRLASR